jgi:hypothetical protein
MAGTLEVGNDAPLLEIPRIIFIDEDGGQFSLTEDLLRRTYRVLKRLERARAYSPRILPASGEEFYWPVDKEIFRVYRPLMEEWDAIMEVVEEKEEQ